MIQSLERVNLECTSALFSTKVQRFLIILRIYNCSNLLFNVTILYYCNFVLIFIHIFIFFHRTYIDSSFFLKTDAAILYKYVSIIIIIIIIIIIVVVIRGTDQSVCMIEVSVLQR